MSPVHRRAPIAVVGPTAVGKSRAAEDVALHLGGEVVSADSMQVYRDMDIGTAKTPPAERRVPHHCLDLVAPGEPYSAARFQHDAREAIADISGRGRVPVIAGGTGLYVRAALDEMDFPAGEVATETRRLLETRAVREGGGVLHAELVQLDPEAAALIHPNNVRRTVRALEMLSEGTSYARQAQGFKQPIAHYHDTRLVGLTMDRDVLYARIDARVDAMMVTGLVAEVERLIAGGYRDALTAGQAIGYKELIPVVEGRSSLDEAVTEIKQSSRRYAKRQLTWFRADERVRWADVTDLSPAQVLETLLDLLESTEHPR